MSSDPTNESFASYALAWCQLGTHLNENSQSKIALENPLMSGNSEKKI